MKNLGLFIILCGLTANAFGFVVSAPEIDSTSAVSAVALLAGCTLVLRSRRK